MGEITDSGLLDRASLNRLKREVKQGPVTIALEVKGNKAAGTLTMNGNAKPFDIETGGPLFADGPGSGFVLACLPLAEGYTAGYRVLDLQKQKTVALQAKVAGSEKVKVAGGEFDAWKIVLTDDTGVERGIHWVAKDSRKLLKSAATLASMNGAQVTAELQAP